jgi:hypothetical protein
MSPKQTIAACVRRRSKQLWDPATFHDQLKDDAWGELSEGMSVSQQPSGQRASLCASSFVSQSGRNRTEAGGPTSLPEDAGDTAQCLP